MRVLTYVYDSATAQSHVSAVLDRLDERAESVDRLDVATRDDREDGIREAMLTVRDAVRIGTNPDGIYDEDGRPDFSAGAMITQASTGRRTLYVGTDALDALDEDADEGRAGDGQTDEEHPEDE
jgi:ribonucleotide monophosphatase NagD (HAD superfamily)